MFTASFLLKQHTPIIHFHNQHGATLRVTELKPKLDKFLWKTLSEAEKADWKIGSTDALDYKVKLVAPAVRFEMIHKSGEPEARGQKIVQFFGNMGDDYAGNEKHFSETPGSISIRFVSFKPELIAKLKTEFPKFLARTNFGTRQNKGYGSFFLANERGQPVLPESELSGIPFLEADVSGWREVFEIVNYYYQRLKSGINYESKDRNTGVVRFSHYQHSFLKKYFSTNHAPFQWEKKWVKEKFLPSVPPDGIIRKFARALLGLPYEFRFKKGPTVVVKHQSGDISRIKSPLTFKPIIFGRKARIYIIVEDFDQSKIVNQTFEFTGDRKTERLQTPPNPLNLTHLLSEYHKELGGSFIAYNFTGPINSNVTVHP